MSLTGPLGKQNGLLWTEVGGKRDQLLPWGIRAAHWFMEALRTLERKTGRLGVRPNCPKLTRPQDTYEQPGATLLLRKPF